MFFFFLSFVDMPELEGGQRKPGSFLFWKVSVIPLHLAIDHDFCQLSAITRRLLCKSLHNLRYTNLEQSNPTFKPNKPNKNRPDLIHRSPPPLLNKHKQTNNQLSSSGGAFFFSPYCLLPSSIHPSIQSSFFLFPFLKMLHRTVLVAVLALFACAHGLQEKRLGGPPSEFARHEVPDSSVGALFQSSATHFFTLEQAGSNVWSHQQQIVVDSSTGFEFSLMSPVLDQLQVELVDPNQNKVDVSSHETRVSVIFGPFHSPSTTVFIFFLFPAFFHLSLLLLFVSCCSCSCSCSRCSCCSCCSCSCWSVLLITSLWQLQQLQPFLTILCFFLLVCLFLLPHRSLVFFSPSVIPSAPSLARSVCGSPSGLLGTARRKSPATCTRLQTQLSAHTP